MKVQEVQYVQENAQEVHDVQQGVSIVKIYVIANQKGGIGKTTTATALTSILSSRGHNSLLIDADMQCNSTDAYRAKFEGESTLYDVLFDTDEIQDAIQHTENGDIVPGDPLLREAEVKFGSDISLVGVLRKKLRRLEGYDYVIIDTAPNLGNLLFSCLLAADSVIVPVTADRFALQGLSQLKESIDKVNEVFEKEVPIEGFLLVMHNERTNLSKEIKSILKESTEAFSTKLFQTTIRESIKAREAQAVRENLIVYAPHSTTAIDYRSFVDELMGE